MRHIVGARRSFTFLSALRRVLAGLLVASVVLSGATTSATRSVSAVLGAELSPAQRLAVPSYFYPGPTWTQLIEGSPVVGLAIINPFNGPGDSPNPHYAAQTVRGQTAGLIVLGYVYTDYGNRSVAEVEADIERYYAWYGVDGIFFDEASDDDAKVDYYRTIHDHVKAQTGRRLVAINPGTRTEEAYLTTADVIVTFEGTYASYTSWELPATAWERNHPADRFWHLVHATTEAELPNAVALSQQRNAGWVYVTPDVMPNPWDTLPADPYWSDLLAAVAGDSPDRGCGAPILPPTGPTAVALSGTVTDDGVNLREGPGLECDVIRTFSAGETVQVLNGTAEADGYTWQKVADADGIEGWVVADFIEIDQPRVKPAG